MVSADEDTSESEDDSNTGWSYKELDRDRAQKGTHLIGGLRRLTMLRWRRFHYHMYNNSDPFIKFTVSYVYAAMY